MPRLRQFCLLVSVVFMAVAGQAQYKGDDIPGFLGLQSGTQAPPGLYVGNVVWVYPTDTIKDTTATRSVITVEVLPPPLT